MKIFFAIPNLDGRYYPEFADSVNKTVALCKKLGHETIISTMKGGCYLALLRNFFVRDFLKTDCDVLFFLDDDLSWNTDAVEMILEAKGEMVAGVYRMKCDEPIFPVCLDLRSENQIVIRDDGCIKAKRLPTGFMRIQRSCLEKMCEAYKDRAFDDITFDKGIREGGIDIFPQGVHNRGYESEDTGFCRLWEEIGGEMWVYPDITFNHYTDKKYFRGNYRQYILNSVVNEKVAA